MHLKSAYFEFRECRVMTVANTSAVIPAGRHLTITLQTANGGVSVRPVGVCIDICQAEWKRLQDSGLVTE